MNENYLHLIWAKTAPFKSILSHSLDTAAVAEALLTNGIFKTILPDLAVWIKKTCSDSSCAEIQNLVLYLASLHDIGKINPFFTGKSDEKGACKLLDSEELIKDYRRDMNQFRHEDYTKSVLLRIWKEKERFESVNARRKDSTTDNLVKILSLHHQGKQGKGKEIPDCDAKNLWKSQQDKLEEIMFDMFHPPQIILNSTTCNHVSATCMVLLGIIILSDWLASSDAFANFDILENEKCVDYYCRIRERAYDLVKRSHLSETELPKGKQFTDIWKNIPRDGMRSLQTVTEHIMEVQEKPLLLLIEAPMGEGKTEAGAYAAFCMGKYFGKKGFYVALPTAATANQMHGRMEQLMKDTLPESQVRLLHSLAWLSDEVTKEESDIFSEDRRYVQEWTKPLRRGLLEGYSVGTVDQVLMSALYVRYGVMRLLGIQNKVLILDEVHAYDAYMQDILQRMLEWCRELRIPVVMLSATLATETKKKVLDVYRVDYKEEQEYPAITAVYENGDYQISPIPEVSKRRVISINTMAILHDLDAIRNCALKTVEGGGCLCILVNTVGRAQKLYQNLKEAAGEEMELYLFHARFAEGRKCEIETQMIELFGADKSKRPHRAIVVSTQVMEQSLDVDFDYMITEIAPIDLILQRLGRMFRHEYTVRPKGCDTPKGIILIPKEQEDFGVNEWVYPQVLLELSMQYLKEHPQISCPEAIREAVEFVYGNESLQYADMEKWMERMFQEDMKRSQAKSYELKKPKGNRFNVFDSDDIFDDSEKRSFLSAKTRLTEPTRRIAIVPGELFGKIKNEQRISGVLAQQVFLYSVSVREQQIEPYFKDMEDAGMLEGTGLLKYMLIFPGKDGMVHIGKDTIFDLNRELGFFIQGGK